MEDARRHVEGRSVHRAAQAGEPMMSTPLTIQAAAVALTTTVMNSPGSCAGSACRATGRHTGPLASVC